EAARVAALRDHPARERGEACERAPPTRVRAREPRGERGRLPGGDELDDDAVLGRIVHARERTPEEVHLREALEELTVRRAATLRALTEAREDAHLHQRAAHLDLLRPEARGLELLDRAVAPPCHHALDLLLERAQARAREIEVEDRVRARARVH